MTGLDFFEAMKAIGATDRELGVIAHVSWRRDGPTAHGWPA
jgi:hypothetical protein